MDNPQDTQSTASLSQEVESASAAFKRALEETQQARQTAFVNQQARNRDRLVSPDALVSDSDLETTSGYLANQVNTLASKTLKLVGDIAGSSLTFINEASVGAKDINEKDLEVYGSILNKRALAKQGKEVTYTPEEELLLKPVEKKGESYYGTKTIDNGNAYNSDKAYSKAETLDTYFKNKGNLNGFYEVTESLEKDVNNAKTVKAIDTLEKTYDVKIDKIKEGFGKITDGDLSGINDLIDGASSLSVEALYNLFTEDTGAVGQTIVESIPAIYAAAKSVPLAFAGTSNANLREALDRFEKENKRIPLQEERTKALTASLASGAVAVYSDRLLSKVGQGVKAGDNVVVNTTGSAIGEAIAEGTETALTEYAVTGDLEEIEGKRVYSASMLGFASGGTIAGVANTAEYVGKQGEKFEAAQVASTLVNSGSVESVEGADLSNAVGISKVLRNTSTLLSNEKTNTETKEEAVILANLALGSLDTRIATATGVLAELETELQKETTPEVKKELKKLESATKLELKLLEETKSNYGTSIKAEYDAINSDTERLDTIKTRLKGNVSESLDELSDNDVTDKFTYRNSAEADKDVDSLIAAIDPEADNVTSDDLREASTNTSISPQKAVELNTNADNMDALSKDYDAVKKEIIYGGKGFLGVVQYQNNINNALRVGNVKVAQKQQGTLQAFSDWMTAKADDYARALTEATQSGERAVVDASKYTKLQKDENGNAVPVSLDANAGQLVAQIAKEARLVKTYSDNINKQVEAYTTPKAEKAVNDEVTENEETNTQEVSETTVDAEPEVTTESTEEVDTTPPIKDVTTPYIFKRKSIISDREYNVEAVDYGLKYDGLSELRIEKESNSKRWYVVNKLTEDKFNKGFTTVEEAVDFIENTDNLNQIDRQINYKLHKERLKNKAEKNNELLKVSLEGVKHSVRYFDLGIKLSKGEITEEEFNKQFKVLNENSALSKEQYTQIHEAYVQLDTLPSKLSDTVIEEKTDTELLTEVAEETVTTSTSREALVDRGYTFNLDGSVRTAPKVEKAKILTEVYADAEPDTNDDTDTAFFKRNHLRTLFKTRQTGLADKINYLDTNQVEELLGKTLTSAEHEMLRNLNKFEGLFLSLKEGTVLPTIKNAIAKRNSSHKNPIVMFSQEDGTYSDDFKKALGRTALEFLETDMPQMNSVTDSNIAAILLRDVDSLNITSYMREQLSGVGSPLTDVQTKLGKIALKNLGLKIDKDQPSNLQNKVITDLGRTVYTALLKEGVFDETQYTLAELNLLGGQYSKDNKGFVKSVRVNDELLTQKLGLTASVELLFSLTDTFTSKLTSEKVEPTKAVINGTAPKTSNVVRKTGGQIASKEFVEGANEYANQEHFINENMDNTFSALGENAIAEILGYTNDIETTRIKGLRSSAEGKNNTILRDIRTYNGFKNRMLEETGGLEAHFNYGYRFARQMRLHAVGADINFQNSKLHRYLTNTKPSVVDATNPDNISFVVFKMAVAQGLGIDIDKQHISKTLYELEAKLLDPQIAKAVTALQKVISKEELTEAEIKDVVEGTKVGGEETHSLKSLMSIAEWKSSTDTTFESTATYEIDGITNGPFNAHIQMGLELDSSGRLTPQSVQRMAQGGAFIGNSVQSYADWISDPKNWDMYQTTASRLYDLGGEFLQDTDPKQAANRNNFLIIKEYVGDIVNVDAETNEISITKAGRKVTKNPVTVTVYAAGQNSISDSLSEAVMDNMYEALEEAIFAKDAKKANRVRNHISQLTGRHFSARDGLDVELYSGDIARMNKAVRYSFGKVLNDAIAVEFASQKEATDLVTLGSNLIHHMFVPMYREAVASKLAELRETGELSKYEYLSENQLAEVRQSLINTMPVYEGYYGDATNGVMASELTTTHTHEKSEKNILFGLESSVKGLGKTTTFKEGFTAPDAGTVAMLNISYGDATTMARAGKKGKHHLGLNVFDAWLTRINDVVKAATTLNESSYEAVANIDLMGNVSSRFEKSSEAFYASGVLDNESTLLDIKKMVMGNSKDHFLKNGQVFKIESNQPYTDEEVNTLVTKENVTQFIESTKFQLGIKAASSTAAKELALSQDMVFNQFEALGDGLRISKGKKVSDIEVSPNQVTDEISKAETMLIEMVKSLPKDVADIDEALADAAPKVKGTKLPYVNPESDQYLVDLFVDNDVVTVGDIKERFLEGIKRPNLRNLMDIVVNNLPESMQIQQMVGPSQTMYKGTTNEVESGDIHGFFEASEFKIYVNAEDQKHTGLRTETFAHELIHATTAYKLQDYITEKNGGPKSSMSDIEKQAAENIYSLYEEAKSAGLESLNTNIDNVLEFVAWGLTNDRAANFIKGLPTKERKIKGFKSRLLVSIRKLLKLGRTEHNVLTELIYNTEALHVGRIQPTQSVTNVRYQKAEENIRKMNVRQIFNNVSKANTKPITRAHQIHLEETIDKAVSLAIDPILLTIPDTNTDMTLEDKQLMDRLNPDITNNLSALHSKGFITTAQEGLAFALYSTVIDSALNEFSWNSRELKRMYTHAKKAMTWEDFVDERALLDTPEDAAYAEDSAKARYNAVFNSTTDGGTSDYLRNFLALAETNETFRTALDNINTPTLAKTQYKGDTFKETLGNIAVAILNFINDFVITRSHERTVKDKLDKLAKNIRARELKEKSRLSKNALKTAGFASNFLNRIDKMAQNRVDNVLAKAKAKYRNRALLNTAINLSSLVLSEQKAGEFAIGLDSLQNYAFKGKETFLASIWTELKGTNASNERIHQLISIKNKMIDQENVRIKQGISQLVTEGFETPLDEKDSVAASKVLLKADVSALIENGYTMDNIEEFLMNPDSLRKAINLNVVSLRNRVPNDLFHYFTNNAKALGRYMARGEVTIDGMQFNANAIVSLHGINRANPNVSVASRNAVDNIASLEALRLTPYMYRRRVGKLIQSENQRTNGEHGVGFITALHTKNKADALAKNFKNSEHNYQKGYTKEIIDPYRSLRIAPLADENELASQGYVRAEKPMPRDESDFNNVPMYIYTSEFGGEATWLQGIASTASKGVKGSDIVDVMDLGGTSIPLEQRHQLIDAITARKKDNVDSLFTPNPRTVNNPLVATTNKEGKAIGYRYLMSETNKDNLLRKDNRVEEVLGGMAAGVTLKVNSEEINNKLIDALHEQFLEDRSNNNLSRYLEIEPNSDDAHLRTLWNLLPREAKDRVKSKFGGNKIMIRNDLLDASFGYRKFSVAELWNPENDYPKAVFKLASKVVEGVYGKNLGRYILKGERGLQELVKELKDVIVIKSIVVMVGNIVSNTVQLPVLHGVSPVKAVSDQVEAFTAASTYRANTKEIFELQTKIEIGRGTKAMKQRVAELVQDQNRNPVKPLMDAGMLQTIVDDASMEDSIYSYKHSIGAKLEGLTNRLPKSVVDGAKVATLSHGTVGYDVLSQTTQLSDFAARYALFNHLTKNEGYNESDALTRIVDAFINYDLPPHKAMQYMNDMGITWFFKYFMRIQKVIIKGFRERPSKVLSFVAGQNMLGTDISNPVNSIFFDVDVTRKIGLLDGIDMATHSHPLAQLY